MTARLVRLLPVLGVIALGSLGWVVGAAPVGMVPTVTLVMLVGAVAVTELLPIRAPRGRPVPTSTAVIATGALLGVDAPVLALLVALGWTLARVVDRRTDVLDELFVRVATAWVLAGVTAWGRGVGPSWQGEGAISLDLLSALLVVGILTVVLPALDVLVSEGRGRRLTGRVVDEIRATWGADLSVASVAVLGALVHDELGLWTLPSVLVPLLAARIGLERLAGVTTAYDQTIRAMSRLPEQLGNVQGEHGVRVGSLAVAVAEELGLDAATRLDIERAAYLHELGHIRLEPTDRPTRAELAEAGARIIASAGDLDRVAAIVAAHGDLTARRTAPRAVALPARIVAACCEAERYDPDLNDAGQTHEVTVRLVRDVEDLDVVQAVLHVLRRDVFADVGGRG